MRFVNPDYAAPSEPLFLFQRIETRKSNPLSRMLIDKMGFNVPNYILNTQLITDSFRNKAPVHFIQNGNNFRLMVHEEWLIDCPYQGIRVFNALCFLSNQGVFIPPFIFHLNVFLWSWKEAPPEVFSRVASDFICSYMKLVEWEQTMDFFHVPLITHFSYDDFRLFENTLYTLKDYRRKLRSSSSGKESKGLQDSGIKVYKRHIKNNHPIYTDRLEFRFQGKYKVDLSPALLYGTVEEAYTILLPAMARMMRQLTSSMGFIFNPAWIAQDIWYLNTLLEKAGWLDSSKVNSARPRRPKQKQ